MLVRNDDHPMYVTEIRQCPHHGVRPHIDIDEFARARVRNEEPIPLVIPCGVVEPNRTTAECHL
jgi:hypothetical protein